PYPSATRQARCEVIVGPGHPYCERAAAGSASAQLHDLGDAAWRLVPAGAGLAALLVWRRSAVARERG
ncbi:hypothetical protein HLK59_46065, partial [Streptomyces sp. S3(2020)]|nr:hypothetical protein [Streptomyces sp. S3(2020)]